MFNNKNLNDSGWGRKPSGLRAIDKARKKGTQYLLMEDGFLRSIHRESRAFSIVHDDLGIYYDAKSSSRLERYISADLNHQQLTRTQHIIEKWQQAKVSKYNSEREYQAELAEKYVLVIDQVFGDLSVEYGLANQQSFLSMLGAALKNHSDCTVVIKIHPDVFTRKKKGYFDLDVLLTMERVNVIAENCHPVRLISHAQAVYTATSQVGFEALIWGKPVYCFGMPFYAGWGLTIDSLPAPDRRKQVTLEQLVYASLVCYPKYTHPDTQESCEVEEIIDYVDFQRSQLHRYPERLYALNFSYWKRQILPLYFKGSIIIFIKQLEELPQHSSLIVWGNKKVENLPSNCQLLRVEDGFLRSAGLGVDLIFPLSWVIDRSGIYYDTSTISDLEKILELTSFEPKLLTRALQLRQNIIDAKVSKYNLIGKEWIRPDNNKKIILVPGQVETDASIRFGSPNIRTNLDLLRKVRLNHPEAYIVYKPHPDVSAGLRKGKILQQRVELFCDEMISSGDIIQILSQIDEVHTMTSLCGFEALLRDIKVVCYGFPFYSGWGLTHDYFTFPRKKRKLTLEELIAGCLIKYPLYLHQETKTYTTPEVIISQLATWKENGVSKMPFYRKIMRFIFRLLKNN